jgi:hypothetical protein
MTEYNKKHTIFTIIKSLYTKKCNICYDQVRHRIKLPSDVGYWVCYNCFSYWLEGYPLDILLKKFSKHYRNKKVY